jgi:CTD kinase subunit beta
MAFSKNSDTLRQEEDFIPPDPPKPHPSFIQVAKPYVFEQIIQQCLATAGVDPQREDTNRVQGVNWIDNVRKSLHLYVGTSVKSLDSEGNGLT